MSTTSEKPKRTRTVASKITGSKILIIAEKPSVARDVSAALPGSFAKEKTHHESDQYIVTWAVGHLVTLCNPAEIDEQHKKWSLDLLPIIPAEFSIKALPNTKSQLSAIVKLLKRTDISTVINGCDAGREGELIFRYILKYAGEKALAGKTIKRLWLQSMTPAAIREGFEKLRENSEMLGLTDAAHSRSEADWLVGINGSRALTGYKNRFGGFRLTPCGRVQTPTLTMIVQREEERRAFKVQPYWEVWAQFGEKGSEYEGKWYDPKLASEKDVSQAESGRIWEEAKAKSIIDVCNGKTAIVEEQSKATTQGSPLLYDLTSIQREGNGRFGLSAKHTLDVIQSLYERHKVVTYPRTDSRHLPQRDIEKVMSVMRQMTHTSLGVHAAKALDEDYIKPTKKVFDDSKVSDHHAIIPTGTVPDGLNELELKVFNMILARFIAVFYPPAKISVTTRISRVGEEHFRTEGKVMQDPGWRAVYGNDNEDKDVLPALPASQKVPYIYGEIRALETKPPARLNESSLLSMMESAGKLVEDEDLRDAMKERGLGTAATRAATIEGLIADKYVVRQGKELVPTPKAEELLEMLRKMHIEELTSPELTGQWEYRLELMARGKEKREKFMSEIVGLTKNMVDKVKGFNEDDSHHKKEIFVDSVSGQPVLETLSVYEIAASKIRIRKYLGGRYIDHTELKELLEKRTLGPLSGFVSKGGKPFSAAIRLTPENKIEFVFDSDSAEAPDFTDKEPVGKSPIDGALVYEDTMSYVSTSFFEEESKTGLKVGKVILGKEITRENMSKLLGGEKTDLIKGFMSTKTKRPFDAFLEMDKKGKLKFTFPPREAGAGGRRFGKFRGKFSKATEE